MGRVSSHPASSSLTLCQFHVGRSMYFRMWPGEEVGRGQEHVAVVAQRQSIVVERTGSVIHMDVLTEKVLGFG